MIRVAKYDIFLFLIHIFLKFINLFPLLLAPNYHGRKDHFISIYPISQANQMERCLVNCHREICIFIYFFLRWLIID